MMQAMSKQWKMVLKTILKVQLIYFFQCNFKKPSHCNGFLLGTWSSLLSSIRNSSSMLLMKTPLLFIEFFHLKSKLWAAEKKVQSMSFLLLWEFCRIKNFFFSPAPLHSAVFKQNFFRQMVLEGFCHMQNSVMTWNSQLCFPDFQSRRGKNKIHAMM